MPDKVTDAGLRATIDRYQASNVALKGQIVEFKLTKESTDYQNIMGQIRANQRAINSLLTFI